MKKFSKSQRQANFKKSFTELSTKRPFFEVLPNVCKILTSWNTNHLKPCRIKLYQFLVWKFGNIISFKHMFRTQNFISYEQLCKIKYKTKFSITKFKNEIFAGKNFLLTSLLQNGHSSTDPPGPFRHQSGCWLRGTETWHRILCFYEESYT